MQFHYGDNVLEITGKFTYLGVVFTTGGSFSEEQDYWVWSSAEIYTGIEQILK